MLIASFHYNCGWYFFKNLIKITIYVNEKLLYSCLCWKTEAWKNYFSYYREELQFSGIPMKNSIPLMRKLHLSIIRMPY